MKTFDEFIQEDQHDINESRLLRKGGADPSKPCRETLDTPLHIAVNYKYKKIQSGRASRWRVCYQLAYLV